MDEVRTTADGYYCYADLGVTTGRAAAPEDAGGMRPSLYAAPPPHKVPRDSPEKAPREGAAVLDADRAAGVSLSVSACCCSARASSMTSCCRDVCRA